MSECYGCGKTLPHFGQQQGYWWMAGKQRSFCSGRSYYPKKPCLTKAFFRLADDHECPICGEGWSHQGQPCDDCEAMLKLGRKTHEETVSLKSRIASAILASFLRFDGYGDSDMSYPFGALVEDRDQRYSLGVEIRRVIVNLWKRWAELHHSKGLVEGSNMLARLSAGETSLVDYEGVREKAVDEIPVIKRDLKKLTLEVVEKARVIKELNDEAKDR